MNLNLERNHFNRKWFFVCVISFLLFILSLLVKPLLYETGHWDLLESPALNTKISVPLYDSRAKGPESSPQKIHFVNQKQTGLNNENIDIQFQFQFYSLKSFENLFQTAPQNNGIRLEADKKGNLVILVGTGINNDFFSALVTHAVHPDQYKITTNTWHTMQIKAWNRQTVVVWLDGVRVANINNHGIQYQLSHLEIGRGFDQSRPFDGVIKDFTLTHQLFNPAYGLHVSQVLISFSILLFVISVISFFKCTRFQLERDQKIEWLSLIVMVGFVAMISYCFWNGIYLGHPYPYNSFLFPPPPGYDTYGDYLGLMVEDDTLNPYYKTTTTARYLPFAYTSTYPLVWFPHISLILMNGAFILTTFLFVKHFFTFSATNNISKIDNIKNILILTFLTYPFLFSFERGNIEVLVFIAMALFLYFYQKGQIYRSAVMIAIGAAMKVFPILLITLFFSKKKYKAAIFTILVCSLLTLVSCMLMQGGFYKNFLGMLAAIHNTTNETAYSTVYKPQFCVDFFTPLRYLYHQTHGTVLTPKIVQIYSLITLVVLGLMTAYVVLIEKILWKKVFLLVAAMLLLPIISSHYKLMHLFLPLALFINEKSEHGSKADFHYLILFALVMIPMNYFLICHGTFTLSSVIDTVALTVMSIVIMGQGVYQFYKARASVPEKRLLVETI